MPDQDFPRSDRAPVFRSVRPRLGALATVNISSAIQASGTLTGLGPKDRGTVDIDGRSVEGQIVPTLRRLNLSEPARPTKIEEQGHDDPSPC